MVFLKDTITVALALNSFGEVRKKYAQNEVGFILSETEVPFRNEALLDMVNRQPSCFFGKLVSAQVAGPRATGRSPRDAPRGGHSLGKQTDRPTTLRMNADR